MDAPRLKIALGELEGISRGNHSAFLGVPFAAPPVGALRFRPPAPLEPWAGVRESKRFAVPCIQGVDFTPGIGLRGPQSEDCLYLNVFTPAVQPDAEGKLRPVMLWVHGGGYTVGTAGMQLYDGGALAELGDVVVVTTNYRLGALGFLHLGEHGASLGARSNLGLLDQIAALRWVREHIAAFGGDPDNITLFGESAGATSVSLLMALPEARPMFRRVIAESPTNALRVASPDRPLRIAERYLELLGLSFADAARLQELPIERLTEAQRTLESDGAWPHFVPVFDGELFKEQPQAAVARGDLEQHALLSGTNRDEWNLFAAMDMRKWAAPLDDDEKLAQLRHFVPRGSDEALVQLFEAYTRSREQRGLPSGPRAVLRAIAGDSRFHVPALRFAEALEQAGSAVYSYMFTHASQALRGELGACHVLELAFVFGSLSAPNQPRFAGEGPAVEALSRSMMQAWCAFARTGDPSCELLGSWPRFDAQQRNTMILDLESRLEQAPFEAERKLWDELGL